MLQSPPDDITIEAWLSGNLSSEESSDLELWLEANPNFLPKLCPPEEENLAELSDLPSRKDDPTLTALIDRVSGGPLSENASPGADSWREVLTPVENDDSILGKIGDYEVIELIAMGGMGIVFKARDPELDRLAAVKVLSPELSANATARKRFLREARAAARLEHDNILPIYGVYDEAIPYFAMRFAPGGTLQEKLDHSDHFDIETLKSITIQVASALKASHEKGIVHRDIKPANILFDEESEQIWVCDFGIALSKDDPSLTYAGAIAGTPKYMSPEQAAGKELDGRSDLYSLGAVLYRCASGKQLRTGGSTASVLQELASDSITKIDIGARTLPRYFCRLLNNLVAHDPQDRPTNAGQVIQAIEEEFSPRPKRTARRRRIFLITTLTTCAIAGFLFLLLQTQAAQDFVNRALAVRHDQAFHIVGKLGAYSTLANAISAADPGGTILLPSSQTISVDNLQIPAGKPLTLQPAVTGVRPVLTTQISGAPGIVSQSPLRLKGLDFRMNPKRDGEGMVIVNSAPLEIDDCEFAYLETKEVHFGDFTPRTVELLNGVDAKITNCRFYVEHLSALTLKGKGNRLSIRNSRIEASYGVDVFSASGKQSQTEVHCDQVTFDGETFLRGPVNPGSDKVAVTGSGNTFRPRDALLWFQGKHPSMLRNAVSWKSENDQFPTGRGDVLVGPARGNNGRLPLEVLNNSEEPFALIEESGVKYDTLREAIESVKSGGTILLSGWHFLGSPEILINKAEGITVKNAPGQRPSLVPLLPEKHVMFFFKPARVSGLRFVRYYSSETSSPMLGFKGEGKGTVIEDCHFESFDSGVGSMPNGQALSVTDVEDAVVRNCFFRSGSAIDLVRIDEAMGISRVRMEECFVSGNNLFVLRWRGDSRDPIEFSLRRCAVFTKRLGVQYRGTPLHQFSFSPSNCILDNSDCILRIDGASQEAINEKFAWHGWNNLYRAGIPGLILDSESSNTRLPELNSLEELLAEIPGGVEEGSISGSPFNREGLTALATPETLLKKVSSAKGAPALKILERFVEP